MRRIRPLRQHLMTLLLVTSSSSWAASYDFTVTAFTGELDEAQASGSFTYTPAEGLALGAAFTDFSLTWDGTTYTEADVLFGYVRHTADQVFGVQDNANTIIVARGVFGSDCGVNSCQKLPAGPTFTIDFGGASYRASSGWPAELVGRQAFFRYARPNGTTGLGVVNFAPQ